MDASRENIWRNDPIIKLDPSKNPPICRDPYSVFLFLGDLADSNDSEQLYRSSREFVDKLINVPEYVEAVRMSEAGENRNPVVQFDDKLASHQDLSTSLQSLLNKYGILLYKAIEVTDQISDPISEGIGSSLNIGEFPKRELLIGTRSLEHLTTALGLVYGEVSNKERDAHEFVKHLLHQGEQPYAINRLVRLNSDFDSEAHVMLSSSTREKIICIVELFNRKEESFYFSAWWNSVVDISIFVDVVNFFWRSVIENGVDDLPSDEDKVFETGITVATQKVVGEEIGEEIVTESLSDLLPLTDEGDILRQYLERYKPLTSVRLNTRAGDIWLNFGTNFNTAPRMGIISHIWDPSLLSQMITFTSKHYIAVADLEEKLKEIDI